MSFILLLGAIILVGMGHSASDLLRNTDFVTLYSYKKAVVNRDRALTNLTAANKASSFWLSDKADAGHCLDMSYFQYPVVSFAPAADPTSPTCQISFGVGPTATDTVMQIAAVYTGDVASCKPGTYPLQVNGGAGVVAATPFLTIAPPAVNGSAPLKFDLSVTTFGYNYVTSRTPAWTACRDARRALADQYLTNTSCETEASPMCTCVRGFTDNLLNWNHRLKYEPAAGVYLEDVLLAGVGRCMDLRRTHDVPLPLDNKYTRSTPLLVFAIALAFNAFYAALDPILRRHELAGRLSHAAFLLLLFLAELIAFLFNSNNTGAGDWRTMLTVLLPAFLVHGLYDAVAEDILSASSADPQQPAPAAYPLTPAPFLHPVVFDLCLAALTLFTLVERVVVQSEYLIVELLKVHAVAALYMGVTWYNRHLHAPNAAEVTKSIYNSAYVKQAYMLLWVVAMTAAFDTMIVPYPSKKGWELHWILPLVFTFWTFYNPVAFHTYPAPPTLGQAYASITRYNDLAGLVAFLFGAILWGYALRSHIQIYGAEHYAYPSIGDLHIPLSTKFR
jgi:hypothetical protein